MKLLIVSDFFFPHWTGISKSVFYLAQALEDDVETTILTVRHDPALKKREKLGKIVVVRKNYQFKLSRACYSFLVVVEMWRLVRQMDVVLINSPSANILPISLIAKLFGKKLIIYHQGDLVLPQGILNCIIETIFNLTSIISFFLADKLATYTQDYLDNSRLLPKFAHKAQAVLIPLPYFQKKNQAKAGCKKIEQQLRQIKGDRFLIGFAGRFVQEKGFDVLLKAIIDLTRQRDDLQFVFAGATWLDYEDFFEQNHQLVEASQQNLSFLGLLNDYELLSFYRSLELFVLPSRTECFGLVQAEAMAAGVPVVVANTPGAREVVKQTGFGLVFESEDVNDLSNKTTKILSKLSTYQKHYPKVKKYFDYERLQQKIRELIVK